MSAKTGFVLIAGAGLRSWAWSDVVSHLDLPSVAVELPKPSGAKDRTLGMDEYVASAVEQAKSLEVDNIIIVAHSLGGVIGLRVAQELKGSVTGFVAVSAAIPKDGGSFVSALLSPQKFIMPLIIRLAGTKPADGVIRKGYCNDLSQELANKVIETFQPEAPRVYLEAGATPLAAIAKLYVTTTNDNEFPAVLQEKMRQNLDAEEVTLEAGHLPMLSKPKELAHILNEFAQKIQS